MEFPITVRYQWTLQEYLAATQQAYRRSFRRVYRILLYFVMAIMLFSLCLRVYQHSFGLSLWIGLIAVAAVVASPWLNRMQRSRQFAKHPIKDVSVEWQFFPEQILNNSEFSRTEFMWSALSEIVETPAGFLLFSSPQIFHWLPAHAFTPDTRAAFIALAQSRVAKYRTVKR